MSTEKRPFWSESVTTAKWWGDVLRDLVMVLKPTQMLLDESSSGQGDRVYQTHNRAVIDRAKKVISLLTPERINAFQDHLAELVLMEMNTGRYPFCSLIQEGHKERNNDRRIHQALEWAKIDPFPFGGSSIFVNPKSTFTRAGVVLAIDEDGIKLVELVGQ